MIVVWLKTGFPGTGLLIGNVSSFDKPPCGSGLKLVILSEPVLVMSAAVIGIVTCVPVTKVVARSTPLSRATELFTNPVPLIVSVNAALPARTVAGLKFVSVGVGFPTVKVNSAELPPPGNGVNTDSFKVPAFAKSATVSVMPNCVTETNVVARSAPFTRTTEFGRNLLPFNVNAVAALPTSVEALSSEVKTGAGLLIVRLSSLEVPPPGVGLSTMILIEPGSLISAAVKAMVNCVADTNVVPRLTPFTLACDVFTNPAPLIVKVKAASPARTIAGLMLVNVGAGLLTVNVDGVERPPPGGGVLTAI